MYKFREEKCTWESPTGERCLLVHREFGDKKNCMNGANPAWTAWGTGNCSITITNEAVERNGDWKVLTP